MICSRCKIDKELSEFYIPRGGDHARKQCRSCVRKRKNINRSVSGRSPKEWRDIAKDKREIELRQKYKTRVFVTTRIGMHSASKKSKIGSMMGGARARANKRGLPYELQGMGRELEARIKAGHCELSGLPFDLQAKRGWNIPSIDRIKPALGYVPDNIRIVCYALNTAMGDWGFDKLAEIVDAVREQNKNCTETS